MPGFGNLRPEHGEIGGSRLECWTEKLPLKAGGRIVSPSEARIDPERCSQTTTDGHQWTQIQRRSAGAGFGFRLHCLVNGIRTAAAIRVHPCPFVVELNGSGSTRPTSGRLECENPESRHDPFCMPCIVFAALVGTGGRFVLCPDMTPSGRPRPAGPHWTARLPFAGEEDRIRVTLP